MTEAAITRGDFGVICCYVYNILVEGLVQCSIKFVIPIYSVYRMDSSNEIFNFLKSSFILKINFD